MHGFVQMLYDKLCSEMTDLRHENSEVRRSLEFTEGSLDDLKKGVIELQTSHRNNTSIGTQLNETLERLRQKLKM